MDTRSRTLRNVIVLAGIMLIVGFCIYRFRSSEDRAVTKSSNVDSSLAPVESAVPTLKPKPPEDVHGTTNVADPTQGETLQPSTVDGLVEDGGPGLPLMYMELIASYLDADKSIAERIKEDIGPEGLLALVRERYDLTKEDGISFAISDVSELVRLSNTLRYVEVWGEGKALLFARTAVNEILKLDPDNVSAQLLNARLLQRENKSAEAVDVYRKTCALISEQGQTGFFAETVSTCVQLEQVEGMKKDQRNSLRQIASTSGIPANCPLGEYLSGASVDVFVGRFMTEPYPEDLKKAEDFLRSNLPPEYFDGRITDEDVKQLGDYNMLIAMKMQYLVMAGEPRAILQLSETLRRSNQPDYMIQYIRAAGHMTAGRYFAALETVDSITTFPEVKGQNWFEPGLNHIRGRIMAESGRYAEAKRCFEMVLQAENIPEGTKNDVTGRLDDVNRRLAVDRK